MLPHLDVVVGQDGRRVDAPVVPLDAPLRDPGTVRRWIEAYRRLTLAQSGVAPPGLPSAFVLQMLLDAHAGVMAAAALRAGVVLDPDPARWTLELEPTFLHPVRVHVAEGAGARVVDDPVTEAREGYLACAEMLARDFPAAAKLSSRQRIGMAHDMWETACSRILAGNPPQRRSCCLIYALPGLQECAGCPRRATRHG